MRDGIDVRVGRRDVMNEMPCLTPGFQEPNTSPRVIAPLVCSHYPTLSSILGRGKERGRV